MKDFIYSLPNWPNFDWDFERLLPLIVEVRNLQGKLTGKMEALGKEKVHFQTPSSEVMASEMKMFLDWFNKENNNTDPVLKARVAHLWFVAIHPFDDGNGRIARAVTDMVLTKSEKNRTAIL